MINVEDLIDAMENGCDPVLTIDEEQKIREALKPYEKEIGLCMKCKGWFPVNGVEGYGKCSVTGGYTPQEGYCHCFEDFQKAVVGIRVCADRALMRIGRADEQQ